ncbi:MAG: hypothetical protein K6E86_00460 [Bacteroidales bacterium]|nr:hypothetical protein [Bacteroidales bacterium]
MKKILITAVTVLLAMTATAQTEQMNAFRNVGVGLEAGLMGAGVEVSMPVITNHLVVKLGYTFPKISFSTDIDIDADGWNGEIDILNKDIAKWNAYCIMAGKSDQQFEKLQKLGNEITVTADAKVNLPNFKVMLEYYPSDKSGFHVVAGVMIGNEDLVSISGSPDDKTLAVYRQAISINNAILASEEAKKQGITGIEDLSTYLRFNIDETTYAVGDNCDVDAAIQISKVKPYLGIGFGRAIPNKRVGFQFEMGAWLHGTPKIVSQYELDTYDSSAEGIEGVGDILGKVTVYPQITFRLTGRIL